MNLSLRNEVDPRSRQRMKVIEYEQVAVRTDELSEAKPPPRCLQPPIGVHQVKSDVPRRPAACAGRWRPSSPFIRLLRVRTVDPSEGPRRVYQADLVAPSTL